MGDGLTVGKQEERRAAVLQRVEAGVLGLGEAATLIGVGERQLRRLLKGYRESGVRSVVHGNRGRRPAHAHPPEQRETILCLVRDKYLGVNHSHLSELLAEREGINIGRSTLSRLLLSAGVRSPLPQRRRSKHRSRRERYSQEGLLLQIDASDHLWLEGRGPRLTLLGVIDDATSKVAGARFEESEDARGYLRLLREVCHETGVPQALYSDRHGIFWPTNGETLKEQLDGRRSPTQFGRAMAEVDIRLIAAHSPQAKGRIERLWGTLQDRLVSELRLAGATTMEEANAYLPGFLRRYNRTFAVAPQVAGSAYRPKLTAAVLDAALCFKNDRVVSNDNTVRIDNMVLQLRPGPNRLGYSKAKVTVVESLDHRFSVTLQGRVIPTSVIPPRLLLTPKPLPARSAPEPASVTPSPPLHTPSANHPWRKHPAVTKSQSN
jgi:transposase